MYGPGSLGYSRSMLPISGMIRYFVATVVLPTRVGMIPCFLEQEECSPPRWGRVHAVRMSAGCVRIGDGFAHVAETQNAAPARDAMSEWGQLCFRGRRSR